MLSLSKLVSTIDKMLEELEKLKAHKDKIGFEPIKNKSKIGFYPEKFENWTGGIPSYGDLELTILDEESQVMYETSQNGDAYYGAITILCKKLNLVDDEGREIYLDYSGLFFVEEFYEGDASRFDYLELEECNLLDINHIQRVVKNYDKK